MQRFYTLLSVLAATLLTQCACDSANESSGASPASWQEGLDTTGINWGIAQEYPGDTGLGNHPAVIAMENFETGSVTLPTEENRFAQNIIVTDSQAHGGRYSGEHSWPEGYFGPTTRFVLPDSIHDHENPSYFVRMCMKFDKSFHPGDLSQAVGVKGFGIYFDNGSGSANTCAGMSWYDVSCQFVGWGPSAKPEANDSFLWVGHLYSYNRYPQTAVADVGDVRITDSPDNTQSCRFSSYAEPMHYLPFDEWRCYELGLYLNTPGMANGEARFWVDGKLLSRVRNMRFRDKEADVPDHVQLNLHRTTPEFSHTMKRWVDDIVIATRYIGPPKP